MLVGLDRLWGLGGGRGLGRSRLAELGAMLGADVPVFVHGHAAWAEGVGEVLTPVDPPEPWHLVLVPNAQVSSAEMYQVPELKRDSAPIRLRALFAREGGGEGADAMSNAFEPVVRARHPAVDEALRWLGRHAEARLTGSGACLFASFGSRADAERILARRPSGIDGFVAKGLNRSPMYQDLQTTLGRRQAVRQRVLIPPLGNEQPQTSKCFLALYLVWNQRQRRRRNLDQSDYDQYDKDDPGQKRFINIPTGC